MKCSILTYDMPKCREWMGGSRKLELCTNSPYDNFWEPNSDINRNLPVHKSKIKFLLTCLGGVMLLGWPPHVALLLLDNCTVCVWYICSMLFVCVCVGTQKHSKNLQATLTCLCSWVRDTWPRNTGRHPTPHPYSYTTVCTYSITLVDKAYKNLQATLNCLCSWVSDLT